jgi:hypothetical protein
MANISVAKVTMFKIANRQGFACICMNNLTEGATTLQAYERMMKAVKRHGHSLPELSASDLKNNLRNI